MDLEKLRILIGVKTLAYIKDFAQLFDQEYQLLFVKQCREVLEIAWEKQADLIILEDEFAAIDSIEMCSLLKNNPKTQNIPVIILTNSQDDVSIQNLSVLATDFLHFPDHPVILKAHIRTFLELSHHRGLLKKIQVADSLSDTPDWPVFEEYTKREWRRGIRYQTPLSLLMLDIDFFDAYREFYGNPTGEDCLSQITHAVTKSVNRVTDFVARYGDDEFTVLLPETHIGGALRVAQRIQEAVDLLDIPHPSSPATDHVTVSIGGVTMLPNEYQEPAEMFHQAFELLQEARRNGYNQIHF